MSNIEVGPVSVQSLADVSDGRIGAVVVGGDYQGLGIVRSLGRRGVPVCVVDDELSIARFSRYCTYFEKLTRLRDERGSVEGLIEIADRLNLHGWVLYPTREEHVAAFSRNRSELSRSFRVPTPEWSSVQWAWDKRNTYRRARELGIPTPATFYPETLDQLRELDGLAAPFAVKPAIKEHFFYATGAKAWRANSHAELKAQFLRASALLGPGEVMIQDIIPGGGEQQFAYCAFFQGGSSIGRMVVRRRRQHPLEFGRASTFVETVDIPYLEELSERFLRATDYYGLVEMEYKLDPRDGQYKLLDVNARTWGYHSLGARAGVDFSYMLYADQVGLSVSCCRSEPGIGWMRMTTDLPTVFVGLLSRNMDLAMYLRSIKKCKVEAVFSREDPRPGLAEILLVPYLAFKKGF